MNLTKIKNLLFHTWVGKKKGNSPKYLGGSGTCQIFKFGQNSLGNTSSTLFFRCWQQDFLLSLYFHSSNATSGEGAGFAVCPRDLMQEFCVLFAPTALSKFVFFWLLVQRKAFDENRIGYDEKFHGVFRICSFLRKLAISSIILLQRFTFYSQFFTNTAGAHGRCSEGTTVYMYSMLTHISHCLLACLYHLCTNIPMCWSRL